MAKSPPKADLNRSQDPLPWKVAGIRAKEHQNSNDLWRRRAGGPIRAYASGRVSQQYRLDAPDEYMIHCGVGKDRAI